MCTQVSCAINMAFPGHVSPHHHHHPLHPLHCFEQGFSFGRTIQQLTFFIQHVVTLEEKKMVCLPHHTKP